MLALILSVLAGFSAAVLSSDGVNRFPPPLSREEESDCFARMRQGDMAARERLIEHNLRLVAHIVRKYYAASAGEEDLISIGTIGLIKSVDSFDADNGTRFATYAARCIQNEILMYFRSRKKLAQEVSIHDTIDTDRDGNALTYEDIIKVDDTIADDIDAKIKITRAADYIMKELDAREREIVILRYGLDGRRPKTQQEAAVRLGISRSYVSRRG
ncbi:MAG: RNA polymerase sporulation sigma factor SigK [Clostridia bacterium]|nr:RNA polymerase sporulation sigma factor SigK [Clostridia bacterium]MBQ8369089.1 RNA polymerase sporulation sigma factor SigK [Clostridia bacterium]MBQ8511395.1 RNA polymerase sporulation sigma factor SigK [Clostridia bacterium]